MKAVAQRAAEAADWNRTADLPKGRGLGIACSRAFPGYAAHVVEVDVTRDGKLTTPKVWSCLDAGQIISPDRVKAQVEGSVIMALSNALYGKVTFKKGRAQQTNHDSFRMVTMSDSPREIFVDIVDSEAAPAGVGETPVPPFAPALCNAIFAATGKRIRNLPLSDHDLSWS